MENQNTYIPTEDCIQLTSVGFIGLGDQGLPMAIAVAEMGYPLHVWARRLATLDKLGNTPCIRHNEVTTLANVCEVVLLCLATDEDVLQVMENGLLTGLRKGSIIVNHGTGTPRNAIRFSEICAQAGIIMLDAPVSGAQAGALAKTLTTMVGGTQEGFDRCEAIFKAFSKQIFFLGAPGSGQYAKLFNNTLLMMNRANISEIIGLIEALGLDPIRIVEALKEGSGSSTALKLMMLNSSIGMEIVEHLSKVEVLDMELFDTAMSEAGLEVGTITVRGLVGAKKLPELALKLNPVKAQTK